MSSTIIRGAVNITCSNGRMDLDVLPLESVEIVSHLIPNDNEVSIYYQAVLSVTDIMMYKCTYFSFETCVPITTGYGQAVFQVSF